MNLENEFFRKDAGKKPKTQFFFLLSTSSNSVLILIAIGIREYVHNKLMFKGTSVPSYLFILIILIKAK